MDNSKKYKNSMLHTFSDGVSLPVTIRGRRQRAPRLRSRDLTAHDTSNSLTFFITLIPFHLPAAHPQLIHVDATGHAVGLCLICETLSIGNASILKERTAHLPEPLP